ncbi:MAG: DUF881 domain-containing protein [Kineosporiaceae bacterium]
MTAGKPRADPESAEPPPETPERPETPEGPEAAEPQRVASGLQAAPGLRRLGSALTTRPNRTQAILAVLMFGLGLAVVTQAQQTEAAGLTGLRQADLVRLLDDVSARGDRLEAERLELEARLRRLNTDSSSAEEARRAAEERRDAYAVLAGTVPTVGPGITVTIRDSEGQVRAAVLLDAVQELRDAGAEAIQIGDVRVVASTAFRDASGGILLGGQLVESPYRIVVIGDPPTLETALRFPGGVSDTVSGLAGADLSVVSGDTVLVDAVVTPGEARFASPDPVDTDAEDT